MSENKGLSKARNSSWIELIILLTVLVSLAWFTAAQSGASSGSAQSAGLLGQVSQLQQHLKLLHDKSEIYLEQAPRDYDDFFRDTMVLHPALLLEISTLEDAIQEIIAVPPTQANEGSARAYLPEEERAALAEAWATFHEGLVDQLGVDPEVPRLEWGFRFINEQTEPLKVALETSVAPLRNQVETAGPVKAGSTMLLVVILAWCGLMAAWFGLRVKSRQ